MLATAPLYLLDISNPHLGPRQVDAQVYIAERFSEERSGFRGRLALFQLKANARMYRADFEKKENTMTTLFGKRFETMTSGNQHSRRRRLFTLGGAAAAGALVLGLFGSHAARGQTTTVSPLQIIALAIGSNEEEAVNLHVKGPSDVLQTQLVFQPGAETGWHKHPGPVVVVIKSGALTETHSNGCVTVHPAGSAFFETKGEVHNASNQTSGVTEVYAVFLSPAGAQPLIPASNPGGVCNY
jgi:quercetin dioxygenase-like cupin family protein